MLYSPEIEFYRNSLIQSGMKVSVVTHDQVPIFRISDRYKKAIPQITCVDDREEEGLGFPGGIIGVAAHQRVTITQAAEEVRSRGFDPTSHGDQKHRLLGCGFNKALIGSIIDGLNHIISLPGVESSLAKPETVLDQAINEANITHRILVGKPHLADKFYLNTVNGFSIDRHSLYNSSAAYVYELWLLKKLSINSELALHVLPQVARLLIPHKTPEMVLVIPGPKRW